MGNHLFMDQLLAALGQLQRHRGTGLRQQHDEFFAAIPRHYVARAIQGLAQRLCDVYQATVSPLVAAQIVVLLEKNDTERRCGICQPWAIGPVIRPALLARLRRAPLRRTSGWSAGAVQPRHARQLLQARTFFQAGLVLRLGCLLLRLAQRLGALGL